MISPPDDRVVPLPFVAEARAYSASRLRFDVQAGLTVAIFAVPQAMAFAVLAGLPPVHGLYSAIVMSIVAALWGSSPFINTGPTNSAALLMASALAPFLQQGNLPALVFQFTLLVGLIRIAMGLLRLGWLVRFVPESAFVGFMTGANLLIALGQLHHLLGVDAARQSTFIARTWDVLSRSGEANLLALAIGLGTFAFMQLLDRFSRRFPVALGAIVLATVAAQASGAYAGAATVRTVRDIAPVPTGLPHLQFFLSDFSLMGDLLPGALAVATIGLIEAVFIGQALALKHRQSLNFNQEFFGQGLSQIAGALFQGFPGSGSFSRSALIEHTGGQTRFANVFFGIFTAVSLLFFARWLEIIPVAALAGLLLFIGVKLFDLRAMRRVWDTDRSDAAVMSVTFLVTVFVRIEYGFFAGVVLAMAFFLNRARDLQLYELVPKIGARNSRDFDEHSYSLGSHHERSDIVALSLHGDLFFGLASDLRQQLGEIARLQQPKFLIIRTRRAHSIDYSCWNAIFEFAKSFQAQGGTLFLSGVRPDLACIITQAGMQDVLPPQQLIPYTEVPWQAFHATVARVAQLLPQDATLSEEWLQYIHPAHARFDTT
ncbi:MAG: sulfate permease, SulP family [Abditibacteriota bacterium]|nr:sulfate permease, SulP family [Abditibacteriota bacterium]